MNCAKHHLGTQGDGNHFLYVGYADYNNNVCIVTHHGSRGFGANLYKEGMKVAVKHTKVVSPKTLKENSWIPYESDDGREYWEALQIVRERTKLNHELIHDEIQSRLGVEKVTRFWNEHNFVFKEGDVFYHAKGATPIKNSFLPDSHGFKIIPLNMSEPILIVQEQDKLFYQEGSMGFAPHGAGRNMTRTSHKKNQKDRTDKEIFLEETKGIDARFFSGNIDISELPSAYKGADEIIEQIKKYGLCQIVGFIKPYGCIMAGDREQDAPRRQKNV